MKTNRSKEQNPHILGKSIILIIVSTGFGFGGFFLIVLLFENFFRQVSNPLDWSLLGGFASLISLALLVGGFTFALVEYIGKENTKHREKTRLSYDMYKTINEKITATAQEAARRWILQNIPVKNDDEDIAEWYKKTNAKIMERNNGTGKELPDGQNFVKMTLNCFDYIGFISEHYWKIEGDSLDWISGPVAKVWKRIGPYVTHIRTIRHVKDYYASAETLSNLCIKWRHDKGLLDDEYVAQTL
jgi:hypothetical protein